MVKKLFKYEIRALARVLLPVWGVLLGIGLLARVIFFFENESVVYGIVSGSARFALGVGIVATAVLTFIISIRRFYVNLYTAEGYLSFTLPVTPVQHIVVKLLTATLFTVGSAIASLAAFCAAHAGEVLLEMWKAALYLAKEAVEKIGAGHFTGYAVEIVLAALLSVTAFYLLVYVCIALGQMVRKNKILAAVGIYFAYYLFTQLLGTVLIIVVTLAADMGFFEALFNFLHDHPLTGAHLLLGGLILWYLIQSVVFFAITNAVTRRKLNLE